MSYRVRATPEQIERVKAMLSEGCGVKCCAYANGLGRTSVRRIRDGQFGTFTVVKRSPKSVNPHGAVKTRAPDGTKLLREPHKCLGCNHKIIQVPCKICEARRYLREQQCER